MPGPLDGVKVVEVAIWWFVPAAGAILADWGAEVIKVEHPETGDPQRALFTSGLVPNTGGVNFMMEQSNRGKKSIGIDLATDGGREVLYELVKDADVFLTNFLGPARRRLKIDVEDIKAVNPAIVYARGTGQGPEGPDADKGGYDAASFWSRGGIGHAITPPHAESPVMQKAAFGDSIGAMTIAGGIAAGLLQKERTGEGPVVDISLLGTAMWVLGPDIVSSKLLEGAGSGSGIPSFTRKSMFNPLVNPYQTKDGRWLLLNMLQADLFWADVCRHIDREDLIEDPRFADGASRFEHREACIAILDEEFAKFTLDEWKVKLDTMEGVWDAVGPRAARRPPGHRQRLPAPAHHPRGRRVRPRRFTGPVRPGLAHPDHPPRTRPAHRGDPPRHGHGLGAPRRPQGGRLDLVTVPSLRNTAPLRSAGVAVVER